MFVRVEAFLYVPLNELFHVLHHLPVLNRIVYLIVFFYFILCAEDKLTECLPIPSMSNNAL